jgi:hypothetical protein
MSEARAMAPTDGEFRMLAQMMADIKESLAEHRRETKASIEETQRQVTDLRIEVGKAKNGIAIGQWIIGLIGLGGIISLGKWLVGPHQ